jgi:hypothetical protein
VNTVPEPEVFTESGNIFQTKNEQVPGFEKERFIKDSFKKSLKNLHKFPWNNDNNSLTMDTLVNVTQIGLILFGSHHTKQPRQAQHHQRQHDFPQKAPQISLQQWLLYLPWAPWAMWHK